MRKEGISFLPEERLFRRPEVGAKRRRKREGEEVGAIWKYKNRRRWKIRKRKIDTEVGVEGNKKAAMKRFPVRSADMSRSKDEK